MSEDVLKENGADGGVSSAEGRAFAAKSQGNSDGTDATGGTVYSGSGVLADNGRAEAAVDKPSSAAAGRNAAQAEPLLRGEGLSKIFESPQGPIPVLERASLEVYPAQSLSIRGESGAGKTTLLYLLSALELPEEGKLYWRGVDALSQSANWRAKQRSQFLGFIFQAYYLIPEVNALENVLMARRLVGGVRREDKERAQGLLDHLGLGNRLKQLPTKLSGGERQRVAVARALMNCPPLILADEPTGNLDERTGEVVMDQLLSLCAMEGVSLVLVTHTPAFAARTDRRIELHSGLLNEV